MGRLGLFNIGARTSEAKFCGSVGQSSPVEEDFEEPMDVVSSDNELHEDFL